MGSLNDTLPRKLTIARNDWTIYEPFSIPVKDADQHFNGSNLIDRCGLCCCGALGLNMVLVEPVYASVWRKNTGKECSSQKEGCEEC